MMKQFLQYYNGWSIVTDRDTGAHWGECQKFFTGKYKSTAEVIAWIDGKDDLGSDYEENGFEPRTIGTIAERFNDCCERAQNHFWLIVAQEWAEINGTKFPTDSAGEFREAVEKAVAVWLSNNMNCLINNKAWSAPQMDDLQAVIDNVMRRNYHL